MGDQVGSLFHSSQRQWKGMALSLELEKLVDEVKVIETVSFVFA